MALGGSSDDGAECVDLADMAGLGDAGPDSIEQKMRLEETELALLSPSQEPSVSDY